MDKNAKDVIGSGNEKLSVKGTTMFSQHKVVVSTTHVASTKYMVVSENLDKRPARVKCHSQPKLTVND